MKEVKLLYQIKSLEKLIFRYFSCDVDINNAPPTPTQMQIIEYILKNNEKDIYQKDLEEILNLRRATVSGVLQTMEKNKLLERVTNSTDARVKKIILNEDAKKIFLKNKKNIEQLEKIVTNNIKEEELDIFLKVINIMKENIINNYNKK